MKLQTFALAFAIIAIAPGCATIFSGTQAKLTVNDGSPSHAKIFLNGNYLGDAPTTFRIPKKSFGKETLIEIRADGYKPLTVKIDKRVQGGYIVLDVLTGLVALIVDFADGAVYDADPKTVNYVLEKL